MGAALEAIDRAVAAVTDPSQRAQIVAAVRSVSPGLVDDVVFGRSAGRLGAAADGELLAVGTGASPGVAVGVVCTSAGSVFELVDQGRDAVLVLDATTPGDEPAIRLAAAVVTRGGGLASHAAIVARHLGIPAVCGAGGLEVASGSLVLVDGGTGEVRRLDGSGGSTAGGERPLRELPASVSMLLGWADELAVQARVLANVDTAAEAAVAAALGATGVGLCRVERHLGNAGARIFHDAVVGVAGSDERVVELLHADVVGLGTAVGRGPVRVRLLDATAAELGVETAESRNPALGIRGVRMALMSERLVRTQVRGIASGAAALAAAGVTCEVGVTVPLVSASEELRVVAGWIREEAAARGVDLHVGAMIETPRAALVAGSIAPHCDYVSFGTNDLTQLTYGLSRDDADGALGQAYVERGIWHRNPFETLDVAGVVRLIALAVDTGRAARPGLVVSICGEHGGDPASIATATQLGVDDVSVSPFRVPAARLALAHAALDLGDR